MEEKVGPALAQRLAEAAPDDQLEVQIFLRQESSPVSIAAADVIKELNRATTVNRIKDAAQQISASFGDSINSLVGTIDHGADKAPPFSKLWEHWINNSIGARVSPDLLRRILERPEVEHVELIPRAKIEELLHGTAEPLLDADLGPLPAAPKIAEQVTLVGAPRLWEMGLRGGRALVAVIDTGIDFDHPDLSNRGWNGGPDFPHHGINFENPDQAPSDENGHGTACAGLIAEDGSSGTLVTGIAPEATLMALRVDGPEDHVQAHVWSALQFAIDHGADVISMSMGWSAEKKPDYTGWRKTCENLLKAGVIFVCSVGNEGLLGESNGSVFHVPRNVAAPAICPPPWLHPAQAPGGLSATIACGETDLDNHGTPGSSRGPGSWETAPFTDYPFSNSGQGLLKPDLCGPGRGSMTCNRTGGPSLHIPFGETSAAAAVVAGCAALLVQAAKRSGKPVIPQRVQQAFEMAAVPIAGQTTKQNDLGSGRVDVFAAYQFGVKNGWW
jgi:subtilisin family serine protease